jgi:hypothetical protein
MSGKLPCYAPLDGTTRYAVVFSILVVGTLLWGYAVAPGGPGGARLGGSPVGSSVAAPSPSTAVSTRDTSQPRIETAELNGAAASVARDAGPSASSSSSWTYLTQAPGLLPVGGGGITAYDAVGGSFAYDAADGYAMYFGGDCPKNGVNLTESFQNGTWTTLQTSAVPSGGRCDMAMAYDSADGYVLAYGGQGNDCHAYNSQNGACNDTWEYRAGVWTQLHPRCYYLGLGYANCSLPPAGGGSPWGHFQMTYDAADGYVLLYAPGSFGPGVPPVTPNGGDWGPWTYRNDTWTYLGYNFSSGKIYTGPAETNLAYDPADGYVLAFGGGNDFLTALGSAGDSDTWKWSNGQWTNITSSVSDAPPPRLTTGMVYDSVIGHVLFFGGENVHCTQVNFYCTAMTTTAYSDTWEYSSAAWTNLSATLSPGYVPFPQLVEDPTDHGVIDLNAQTWEQAEVQNSSSPELNSRNQSQTWYWGATPPLSNVTLSAPATADAGTPITLSVLFNGGTPPVSIRWTFGDGTGASGMSVSHSYASPGTYNASVLVQDAAGHSAVGYREIVLTVHTSGSRLLGLPGLEGYELAAAIATVGGAVTALVLFRIRRPPRTVQRKLDQYDGPI